MSEARAVDARGLPRLAAEDHVCDTCRLAYLDINVEHAMEVVSGLPAAVRAAVAAIPAEDRRVRPQPAEWSIAEYVCHLRDVYVASTIRLHRVRTEDHPALEPMLNDLRARRFRYNECDLATVIDEMASAVAGFGDEVARTTDWDRRARRLPGEVRTARWLVRQAMHEGVHHLADIPRVAGTVANSSG